MRESIEANQLTQMRERGIDLTIFSPRASFMAHHIGDLGVSTEWAAICNELCFRVSRLFPAHFAGAAMLPQSPGVDAATCVAEIRKSARHRPADQGDPGRQHPVRVGDDRCGARHRPGDGHHFDDTKRYVDATANLSPADHHCVVAGNLAYASWRDGGLTVVDISEPTDPRILVHCHDAPPYGPGTHSPLPIPSRDLLVLLDEPTFDHCSQGLRYIWTYDVRDLANPKVISTFPQPEEADYCAKGGAFGPHNFHEMRPGSFQSSHRSAPEQGNGADHHGLLRRSSRLDAWGMPARMNGFFTPNTPLYTEAGGEVLKAGGNIAKATLAASGYKGGSATGRRIPQLCLNRILSLPADTQAGRSRYGWT